MGRIERETSGPLLNARDLIDLAVLAAGGAAAAATPEALDPAAVRLLMGLQVTAGRGKLRSAAERIEAALPERRGQGRRLAEELARMRMEDFWGRLRGIGPRAWRPEIEIEGLERVEAAKRRGRGVIVWGTRTASATAIKQAFFQAGLPLRHLTQVAHGANSSSKLALRVVAPLSCRAENPYLASRVQIPLGGSLAYLKELSALLRANECVSIFAEHESRQSVEAPLLGGSRRFATGAPSLAWKEGAELLVVHCFRTGPFRYRVAVDEPIRADRSLPRKAYARAAVLELAGRLERVVRERPQDWQGWWYWGPRR